MSVRWLAVALFLCASFLSLGSAGAQGTSTLTVHARYCDPGVIPDDPFLECHDNPLTEWGVNVDGPEPVGETDAEGNFSLDGLDAGDYELYVQAPLKATTFRVYCSEVDGDGTFLELTESGNGMAIPVAAGVEVICDWYWLISDGPIAGEPTTLTIHARICPSDELPADIFATCHDTAGENIEFFVNGASVGSTN
ncbi:MAG: carboxypeptidase-like regulatory domain-containing protein, partial [Chloroflexota bacterium]|nr:carboxypeptidase-like regulatory domain-containing protein [Chloroflexota bacterium]